LCIFSGKISQHKRLRSDKLRSFRIPWRPPKPSFRKNLRVEI